MSVVFPVMSSSRQQSSAPGQLGGSLRAPTGAAPHPSPRLLTAGRVSVLQGPLDGDLHGGGGHRYTETGVDRTPPRGGNATAGTPAGSTAAAERWAETKRRGRPRSGPGTDPPLTDRPLTPGEALTTGVAKRALALEPGRFRYAYRTGHAARPGVVTRSIENRMETITSMAQTRGDAFSSSRTSRILTRMESKFTIRVHV